MAHPSGMSVTLRGAATGMVYCSLMATESHTRNPNTIEARISLKRFFVIIDGA
jgi:hypothetical protein